MKKTTEMHENSYGNSNNNHQYQLISVTRLPDLVPVTDFSLQIFTAIKWIDQGVKTNFVRQFLDYYGIRLDTYEVYPYSLAYFLGLYGSKLAFYGLLETYKDNSIEEKLASLRLFAIGALLSSDWDLYDSCLVHKINGCSISTESIIEESVSHKFFEPAETIIEEDPRKIDEISYDLGCDGYELSIEWLICKHNASINAAVEGAASGNHHELVIKMVTEGLGNRVADKDLAASVAAFSGHVALTLELIGDYGADIQYAMDGARDGNKDGNNNTMLQELNKVSVGNSVQWVNHVKQTSNNGFYKH